MRRFLLALAVLATASATPAFAGYIIIRVLLEGSGSGHDGTGGSGPMSPPGGSSLGPMGTGFGSSKGGPPVGSSKGGPPGGLPVGSSKGGPPGGSMRPPEGMFGGQTPHAHPGEPEADPTRSIVVVIPLETDFLKGRLDPLKAFNAQNNPEYRKFHVPALGQKLTAALFIDSSTIQLYEDLLGTPGLKKTLGTEMRAKHQAWLKGKNDLQVLYDAMLLALQAGHVKEALAYADELMTVAAEQKLALPERDVKPFVAAWGAVQKAVTGPATQPSDAEDWKARLDYRAVRVVGHYAIIYTDNPITEVDRRAGQLNDNFAAFYLWHATQGNVLPVPEKPLVTVLATQGTAMRGLHHALDGLPMADAFYSPDHNVLVLSPERMDDVGQTFLRQNQQVFVKGLNRDQLLLGQIPKLDHNGEKGSKPEDVAHASTLAAVEKMAIEEADLAAVSREGTRQLMYVTATLPKHVTLPSWLTNGSVNFYTRPRGPAYITVGDEEKPNMHVAPATGYGVPNYVLQRHFRDFNTKKELPAESDRLLENVLGDVYFNGIKNGDDPDPSPPKKTKKPGPVVVGTGPGPGTGLGTGPSFKPPLGGTGSYKPPMGGGSSMIPPGTSMPPGMSGGAGMYGTHATDQEDPAIALRKKQQRLALKANATSWALYYYLVKHKPDQLRQYIAELNKLPRDLPIDGRTAYAVFVRVFKLSKTEDGPADAKEMKKFADEWLTYIKTVPVVGYDVPLVVPEAQSTTTTPGGGSKAPGGIGSPP